MPAIATPSQVLLLRHGHKDPAGVSYNLSEQGFNRAIALAGVIPACFGKPTHIIVFNVDPETSKNGRSYQSAVPLAVASRVNIRIETASHDSAQAARRILTDPAYTEGLVVLFWEHRHLPALAAAFGWSSMPTIANDDFDGLDQLLYRPPTRQPLVRRWSQAALIDGTQPCGRLLPLP